MTIYLIDNTLAVDVYYDRTDSEFADNICVSIREECPDDERLLRAEETNLYLTREQACQLAKVLFDAAQASCDDIQASTS